MLFRDTPVTEFERCGRTNLPIGGDARECVAAAMQAQRPFVVELETTRPVPPHQQPVIAGAEFDGRYRLRSYLVPQEGQGERSEVEFVVDTTHSELSLQPRPAPTLRCLQTGERPSEHEFGWRKVDERYEVHAARCVEWFDDVQWQRQPWRVSFDASKRLECMP